MAEEVQITKKQRRMAFLISFAVTFCIMTAFALGAVYWLGPMTHSSGTSSDAPGMAYLPTEEDNLSMLVIGTDPSGNAPPTFALVGFYPADGRIPVAVLPQDTLVTGKTKSDTLAGVFRVGGVLYTKLALEESLGMVIDRYAVIELDNFISVINLLGTTDFNLPLNLDASLGGREIKLTEGTQKLDGRKMADIFIYPDYKGGEPARCAMAAELIRTVINNHLPLVMTKAVDSVFKSVVNATETDVSQTDYQQRKDAAAFMSRLEVQPGMVVTLSGRYNAAGNTYVLDDATNQALKDAFP